MSKNERRGKGLWHIPGRARGTCPLCFRRRVKLIYSREVQGQPAKVCKRCRNRAAA